MKPAALDHKPLTLSSTSVPQTLAPFPPVDAPATAQIAPWRHVSTLPPHSTPPIDCHMLKGASGAGSPARGGTPHGIDGKGFGVVVRILRVSFRFESH